MEENKKIEEAAEKFVNSTRFKNPKSLFCEGAKWQQENSYSQVINLFINEIKTEFKDENCDYLDFIKDRVIEQFKNK
jgi:hypothetical protein